MIEITHKEIRAKEKAKKEIVRLVKLYESKKTNEKEYSESDTETKFIEPLYEALGWNISEKKVGSSVYKRKKQQDERLFPDHTFKILDRTQFFSESKLLKFNGFTSYKRFR